MDVYHFNQTTLIPNFFLAGKYTNQDYIDSIGIMEGVTIFGKLCSKVILEFTAQA
jgi:zeta-carotene desaturase